MSEIPDPQELPTWELVLRVATELTTRGNTPFELQRLVSEVQTLDPMRSRESIQPVIQGLTHNATGGPRSQAGTPLERVDRGLYVLREAVAVPATHEGPVRQSHHVTRIPTIIWTELGQRMRSLMDRDLEHLLTEDVLRFQLISVLIDSGTEPHELQTEVRVPGVGALDLEIHGAFDAAIELKFPRDPKGSGAADTMTLGELLKDFYKVACSGRLNAVVLQLTDRRLRRYLTKRTPPEPVWTFEPGGTIELTPEAVTALPKTARDVTMGRLSQSTRVQGHCVFAEDIGSWKLTVYEITSQAMDDA